MLARHFPRSQSVEYLVLAGRRRSSPFSRVPLLLSSESAQSGRVDLTFAKLCPDKDLLDGLCGAGGVDVTALITVSRRQMRAQPQVIHKVK